MAQRVDEFERSQLDLLFAFPSMANSKIHAARGADGKPRMVGSPVSEDAIRRHRSGGQAIELYPVAGDTARWGAWDLDFHGANAATVEKRVAILRRLTDTLVKKRIKFLPVLSGGGVGFHVHIAFVGWIPARDIRHFMAKVTEEAGFKVGPGGALKGEVEAFPKQDSVGNGIGNCIALPLGRKSLPLDPVTLAVIAKTLWCAPGLDDLLNAAPPAAPAPAKQRKRSNRPAATAEQVAELLPHLNGSDRESWIRVGMAIHHILGDEGFDLWLEWSKGHDGYVDERDCQNNWDSFGRGSHKFRLGYGSLVKWAKEGGWKRPASNQRVLNRKDPRGSGRAFLEDRYPGTPGHGPDLVWYQQEFYAHRDGPWARVSGSSLRAQVGEYLENCVDADDEAFRPRSREQTEIIDAIEDLTLLEPANEASPPFWRSGEGPEDPNSFISVANGLLEVATGKLYPHNRDLFTLSHHDIEYDPDCPPPARFLAFLAGLWPNDQGEIALLQEWMGLVLTTDTSFQKLLLMIGPRRAGKSTIANLAAELVGARNATVADLQSLTETFGLEPLIDRTLIMVPDARFGGGKDQARAVSRLNSIVGEDRVQANRKNRTTWVGVLRGRFLIVTNEAPKLIDHAGALAGRIIPLVFETSFEGREDADLKDALTKELPEIFHWALAGYRRLKAAQAFGQHPTFTIPPSSKEFSVGLSEQMSPISAFAADYLDIEKGAFCPLPELKAAYAQWCGDQGYTYVAPMAEVIRQLSTFSSLIKAGQPRSGRGVFGVKIRARTAREDSEDDDGSLPF